MMYEVMNPLASMRVSGSQLTFISDEEIQSILIFWGETDGTAKLNNQLKIYHKTQHIHYLLPQ